MDYALQQAFGFGGGESGGAGEQSADFFRGGVSVTDFAMGQIVGRKGCVP